MSHTVKHLIEQVNQDIRYLLIEVDPSDYSSKLEVFNGSSIGEHMRHILNFYQCIEDVLTREERSEINYAKRKRDTRIECDPEFALEVYNQSILNIHHCENQWGRSIPVRILVNEQGPPAMSTICRELFYACEHAIHHLAIIMVGIRGAGLDISLPENFGVAPSTVDYRIEGK